MNQLEVLDIMTTNVITIEHDENLEVAEQLMRAGRVNHLPVMARNRIVGIIAKQDLLRAQVSSFADLSPMEEQEIKRCIPVSKVMSSTVCAVTSRTPAIQAAQMMRRYKYGCLPVIDDDELVGIITEGDFVDLVVRALLPDLDAMVTPLHAVMDDLSTSEQN